MHSLVFAAKTKPSNPHLNFQTDKKHITTLSRLIEKLPYHDSLLLLNEM